MNIQQDSIQVVIRVRPNQTGSFLNISESNIILGNTNFTFDQIFFPDATQTDIYRHTGYKQIQHTLEGYNSCLFVYGQTGSGKTHTMIGQNNGIIQQSLRHLFSKIADNLENDYQITCSYYEIYNEQIFDLLDINKDKKLNVREDVKKGVFIDGLMQSEIASTEDGISLLNQGIRTRHVGQTLMNRQSSRSHAIYSLTVVSKFIENGSSILKKSKIHFVDLAGSERQKSTAAVGDRLKQASNINRSLTTLGMVINCLSGDSKQHVPFRNSKLTFVLRDSLGGNSKTFLIATIADNQNSIQETLSTLKFAQRAKMVKLNASINQQSLSLNAEVLKSQIRRLKDELIRVHYELEQQKQKKSSTPYNNVVVNSYSKSMENFNDKINCLLELIPKLLNKQPSEINVEQYFKNNTEMLSSMSESLSRLIELKNQVRAKASLEKLRLQQLQPYKYSTTKLNIRKDRQQFGVKLQIENKQTNDEIHILLKQQELMRIEGDKAIFEKNQQYNFLMSKYQCLENKTFETEQSNSNLLFELELIKQKLNTFEQKVQSNGQLLTNYQNQIKQSEILRQGLNKNILQLTQNIFRNQTKYKQQIEQVEGKLQQQQKQFTKAINELNQQYVSKEQQLIRVNASYEEKLQGVTQEFIQIRDQNFSFQSQLVSLQTQMALLNKENDKLKRESSNQQNSNLSLTQKISLFEEEVLLLKQAEKKQVQELEKEKLKHSEQITDLHRSFSSQSQNYKQSEKLKQKCNQLIIQNYKLKTTSKVQQIPDNTEITTKLDFYEQKFNLMKMEYNKSIETIRILKQRQILLKEQNLKLVTTMKDHELQKYLPASIHQSETSAKVQKKISREFGKQNQTKLLSSNSSSSNVQKLKEVILRFDFQAFSSSKINYQFQELLSILQQTVKNKQSNIKKQVQKQVKLKSQNHLILKQNVYLKERIRNMQEPNYATKSPSKKQRIN